MIDWNGFISKYGLVTMANGDAGDAPMKTAFKAVGEYIQTKDTVYQAQLRTQYDKALATIMTNGQLVRYPEPGDSTPPWNDPKDVSRDQTWPTFAACHILGLEGRRDILIDAMLKGRSQAQNGDLLGPDIWAAVARSKRMWYLWPLLLVADLAILINTFIQLVKAFNPDNVGDDNNHCMMLLFTKLYYPTPISWASRKIYKWVRAYSYGSYLLWGQKDDNRARADWLDDEHTRSAVKRPAVEGAFAWYWRPSIGAPPMTDLWAPILKDF